MGFPGGTVVKKLPANAWDSGDVSSVPGSGRCSVGGNSNPLQYSYLGNPMERGTWQARVHRVKKNWTQLSTHVHSTYNWNLKKKKTYKSTYSQNRDSKTRRNLAVTKGEMGTEGGINYVVEINIYTLLHGDWVFLVVQWKRICLHFRSRRRCKFNLSGSRRSLGGGNGSPLQYSCLENPMDRGA